ncbi:MAG: IS21 family transposase [Solirubrobacterales bacterium]|nr:IS21 family transposase [Solirubrobacterales bacterium]
MLDVEQWAQIRRMHVVDGVSIKEIARRTGLARNTVRAALRSERPPSYERALRPSKLDPFKAEVERLLRADSRIPNTRIRELIGELGYVGGKTILDTHLRELRPLLAPKRTYQRTVYRPGEICQFDLWEPRAEIPVGHGQTRRGWVVTCALGFSRAGAGALIFAKQAPDILWGMSSCLGKLGALPDTVVWDRESAIAPRGKPTEAFAAFCGALPIGWSICQAADPEAKGILERSHRFLRSNFEPGRAFASSEHFQATLDEWFAKRANTRLHRGIRAIPAEPRLASWIQEAEACVDGYRRCLDQRRQYGLTLPRQPLDQPALVAARDEQTGVAEEGLSDLDLPFVALGVDHEDAGRRDRKVVDVRAATGHPAVVEDDRLGAGLRQMDGQCLLAGGAGVPSGLARRCGLQLERLSEIS